MANSKNSSLSSISSGRRDFPVTPASAHQRGSFSGRIRLPKDSYRNQFELLESQINVEGVHIWPFDAACPVDVQFMTVDHRRTVRMNRHRYFEVLYLCSGSSNCHIQDRLLPFNQGDLAIIGSTLYHRIECQSSKPVTMAALFFEPDLIRCDGASDSAEYLVPFLLQDREFPHIVSAGTGVPRQVLDLILRIGAELPASSARGKLGLKTYMKMLLMLLVNQYASYAGTAETYERQQRNLERLRPLFRYLGENCGNQVHVCEASRICGMSESHFMSLFKQVTGLSFVTYLNHFRIERAQALLAKTDESMAGISQQVGFCDQSYFGTVFRRIVGMIPAIYRKRIQSNTLVDPRQPYHMPPLNSIGKVAQAVPSNEFSIDPAQVRLLRRNAGA
jgi:AraC-like DNA-binding protein/mannose-6-phosphate isomerase-like protein (cupin superfamily)